MKRVPRWSNAAFVAGVVLLTGCEAGPDRSEIREAVRVLVEDQLRPAPFETDDNPAPSDLQAQAREVARQHALEPALVESVVEVESDWDPRAQSHKGARGLMQIMPETAREEYGLGDPEVLYEPAVNLRLGVSHLHDLLERFCEPRLALWAWHAGAGAVEPGASRITPSESRAFVRRVLARYRNRADQSESLVASAGSTGKCRETPRVEEEPERHVRIRGALVSEESEPTEAPEPAITGARISALRVRIGEPVDVRIEATNRGGSARAGEIVVGLPDHPRMQVGYGSDLEAAFYASGEPYRHLGGTVAGAHDPVILARANSWDPGTKHTLRLRLVPAETGTITLRYRLSLEGPDGRVYRYPEGSHMSSREPPGRRAQITVTRTLEGEIR